jgi:hypothetical protein
LTSRPIIPLTLGFLWGLLIFAAVNLGTFETAVLLVPVAGLAAATAVKAAPGGPARRGKKKGGRRVPAAVPVVMSASVGALLPLAALGGPVVAVAALILLGGAGSALLVASAPRASAIALARSILSFLSPAVAALSVVLARGQGANEAAALVAAICAYDAGSFLMGNARTAVGGPLGVASGAVSVAVVALFVAALMDPPFSGHRPWILFGAIVLLAPLGVALTDRVDRGIRLPAVRRLDSLVLAGPAWVICVAFVLHR